MEPREYEAFFSVEADHWWFKGLRCTLMDVVKRLNLSTADRILDAGCGTGMNLQTLRRLVSEHVIGFDLSPHAARFWPARALRDMCRASVNEIPYRDDVFAAALCVTVLEGEAVDERAAIRELCRVVRPGGHIIVVVSAYQWLMDGMHDVAVHTNRRYTRRRLRELASLAPLQVVRSTYLFPSVFPAIAGWRLLRKVFDRYGKRTPRSDVGPVPSVLNAALFRLVDFERSVLHNVNFPFGSSILAVLRKTV